MLAVRILTIFRHLEMHAKGLKRVHWVGILICQSRKCREEIFLRVMGELLTKSYQNSANQAGIEVIHSFSSGASIKLTSASSERAYHLQFSQNSGKHNKFEKCVCVMKLCC
ncbi:hypothetical protein T4B_15240 [Trichinella pseudospiralis]|uniref:Uncharacterized protein n=1 Tax=Trichinella pseudospiralis TaxID=6337 RepID=A0A0V1IPU3_TRIPS|nr:hypothetical protein T4B_15240 [Trichinella pseudospiralis]